MAGSAWLHAAIPASAASAHPNLIQCRIDRILP
jgi:hypothetical protein